MGTNAEARMRELTLDGLLEAFAARTPAPGGGAGAGVAAALAAALTEMGARFAGLDDVATRAAELRARALELAEADAAGYAPVLEAVRLAADAPGRDERLHAALSAAADVPLALADAAAEAAALARRVAAEGRPALAGDALTGAELAAAAAAAAARLVAIDLEHARDDPRRARAEAAARAAAGTGG
jgi:formiminotetrahydrofolate cyclodeaminase